MRIQCNTKELNTICRKYVPIILLGLGLFLSTACERGEQETGFSPEESFFIEQYLRLVEARQHAVRGDSIAAGRFNFLKSELPSDSLRAVAARISSESPRRWAPIFEEIVRRKRIMESEGR
jgi:hypothetical protein